MTRISLRVLQDEHLPCDSCGGKCCTFAPFAPSELRRARLANGGSYPQGATVIGWLPLKKEFGGGAGGHASMVVKEDGETCAFLADGRCSIYEVRPRACRDYGRVPELPCRVLHPKEAQAIGLRNLASIRRALGK